MELLIFLIVVFVLLASYKMHYDKKNTEVDIVTSKQDQHDYLVRNLPDKEHAADLLAEIRTRLTKLVTYLKSNYQTDDRIVRLTEKFNPDHISEGSDDSTYTSYSVNKGEKLVFCLRQRDQTDDLLDINTMMFVAIHELAHIMTKSVGHAPEFWSNMRFLLDAAMSNHLQVYSYQPYHRQPQPYCGITISDTPLKL